MHDGWDPDEGSEFGAAGWIIGVWAVLLACAAIWWAALLIGWLSDLIQAALS